LTTGGGCETRMENEVIDKIRVLFDSFQQHEEKLDRIEQKVDAISVSISCRTLLALSLTEGARIDIPAPARYIRPPGE